MNKTKTKFDCIIVGGGASGLYAASHLPDQSILVIEKMAQVGMKMRITGGGQCNVTHGGYINHFYDHYHAPKSFIKKALTTHSNQAVMAFFESMGIPLMVRDDGKVFPVSLRSDEIINGLKKKIQNNSKSKLMVNLSVVSIAFDESSTLFKVMTKSHDDMVEYQSKSVVIATGGITFPKLGSTGDGYQFAEHFGHTIIKTTSGLSSIRIDRKKWALLQGMSFDTIKIEHNRGEKNQMIGRYQGDMLITHFGLSGPVILNNSYNMKANDKLNIQFTQENSKELTAEFLKLARDQGGKPIAFFLNHLGLKERFKHHILMETKLDGTEKIGQISKEKRNELIDYLSNCTVVIENLMGIDHGMITAGGVDLDEIDRDTMMSLKQANLYFTGEVMNVDGETGGYNLQWAFSSAHLVAQSIISRRENDI